MVFSGWEEHEERDEKEKKVVLKGSLDPQFARFFLSLTTRVNWTEPTWSSRVRDRNRSGRVWVGTEWHETTLQSSKSTATVRRQIQEMTSLRL